MTTPTETHEAERRHLLNESTGMLILCGEGPLTPSTPTTSFGVHVTCPACLAVMWGPAVVSGLDTAAATAPCYCRGGTEQRHADGNMCPGVIAGTVPAPVSAPAGEATPGDWYEHVRYVCDSAPTCACACAHSKMAHQHSHVASVPAQCGASGCSCLEFAAAPAGQAAPAETPPLGESIVHYGDGHPTPVISLCGAEGFCTFDRPRVTCPLCRAKMDEPPNCKGCDGTGLETATGGYEEPCRLCVPLPPIATPAAAPGQSTPVETPPAEPTYPCADCGVKRTKDEGGLVFTVCDECWEKHYGTPMTAAPAPPGPVKPKPPMCTCADDFGPMAPCVPPCPLTKPKKTAAAAPAPGVGEGPRELTFAEACEALVAKRGKVQYRFGGEWKDWDAPFTEAACLSPVMVVQWSNYKWRLKPEPQPAPKPGRVAELLENFFAHRADIDVRLAKKLCRQVVEATLEAVRTATFTRGPDEVALDAARVAMLGAEAGK